jgi:hypothetical protein
MPDPFKEQRALMASMPDPFKEQRALMASMPDPLKEFRASIAAIPNSLMDFSASVANSASLKLLKVIAANTNPNLSFEANGVVSLSTKRMAFSDLQEISSKILRDSSLVQSGSLEECINKLVEAIGSQKDPLTQKILISFIYPLIIVIIGSFLNPVADHYAKSRIFNDKRALAKQVSSSLMTSDFDKNIINSFRYVSADILKVRYAATQKSKVIGYLNFGHAVLVLERKKNWTLIEWKDSEAEVQITGWVFSRYLSKFK